MSARMIIPFLIMISILYCGLLFIVWSIYTAIDKDMNIISYFIPLMIEFFFGFGTFISYHICECLYTAMYTTMGTFMALELYMFLCSIVHQIIEACTDIPLGWSLAIIVGVPVAIVVFGLIWVSIIHIDEITLNYPGFKGKKKIAHISDIHLGALYRKGLSQKLVDKINTIQPDVVVITGDLADGSLRVKADWVSPFDTLTVPVLYITGNHEALHGKPEIVSVIEGTNMKYIGNEVMEVCGLNFIGVDFEYKLTKRLEQLSPKFATDKPNILLCHIPSMKPEELEKYNIFLFLAGHTHGGQVFPFQLFAYLGNACFAGLYSHNNHHVYVSTGVSAAVCPLRVGSSSVIGVINIEG